jgi:hypothetical protein
MGGEGEGGRKRGREREGERVEKGEREKERERKGGREGERGSWLTDREGRCIGKDRKGEDEINKIRFSRIKCINSLILRFG